MSGLKDYYELDFARNAVVKYELSFVKGGGKLDVPFLGQAHIDFSSHTKFCSFYIPEQLAGDGMKICLAALSSAGDVLSLKHGKEFRLPKADGSWSGQGIQVMANDYLNIDLKLLVGGSYSADDFLHAPPLYIYIEGDLLESEEQEIIKVGKKYGFEVIIRGVRYSMERVKIEKPVAFISHDSRDKESIARPIAEQLTKAGIPVWFDEYSLKIGDRLRESIEKGMKECKKCILVLTPNFLANAGWTTAEFNMIFTREIIEEKSLVIPIWAGIEKMDVYNYSPALVNVLGAVWDQNNQERVIRRIAQALED